MIKRIRKLLSPLAVKIFIGFWFITIISIVTTRFISIQLANDYIAHPASQNDIKQVTRVSKKLKEYSENNEFADLSELTDGLFEKRSFRRIYLKDVNTGDIYSARPIKRKRLKEYLSTEKFDNPVSIHTKGYYLVGPQRITLGNTPVDVFWSHRGPSRHQPGFFSLLPPWAKIGIPLTISFILCWILSWSITKPIRAITETTKELGEGKLSARVENHSLSNSEIGGLSQSVNQMAAQLETLVTSQQRLLADISHELRSPLTRLQLALALANKIDDKPQELDKYLARFELEIGRLDELIENVLQLSRLENSIHATHFQSINLSQLLHQIKADGEIMASKKSIAVNLEPLDENLTLMADGQLLTRAIENIVTNAIKYGPEGSTVKIKTSIAVDEIIITILDQGQGVPEQDINQIFEPFYRVHDARDRATGGTGLGLAIAKRAVATHKGNISATNTESGFAVNIVLPLKTNGNIEQD